MATLPEEQRSFLEADALDLISKGFLTKDDWDALKSGDHDVAKTSIREKRNEQLSTAIQNALANQPTDQILQSDIIAAAAGGLWGAATAWLKTTPILNPAPNPPPPSTAREATPVPSTSHLWNSAKEAALKSMETNRKIRTVDFLELSHVCGNEETCEHIVIAINGFMTHGYSPSLNWEALFRMKNVASYVVLWEAGNAAEWDAFCNETGNHLKNGEDDTIASHFTVGNPWNKAQNKAHQVGIVLAELLISKPVFARDRKVTLIGHSLGSAVIHSALQHLATYNTIPGNLPVHLHQAVFFAGAFVPDHDFSAINNTVFTHKDHTKGILNVYSSQDHILMHLFSLVNMHIQRPAAGCSPIDSRYVANICVTDLVPSNDVSLLGHSYEPFMVNILDRIGATMDLPNAVKIDQ
ncbi:unnamed protein product [Aphanomyces euteiches]|uniref:Uncharacterized protein n=1 Tax=Aphanomyces euteiches TaxID=100861 RepID=A0A6G0XYQ1_9STRA|nr:hypothetical protein Ae201684_000200 [Aphanomyces euteiches]KAH9091519.1 hypothetical protein Ae201684P_011064 [Aphanomyces euteiches]KAH9156568.1 hypothetical protein AeRB84_001518 [Aphanomyces euteiches]